MEPQSQVGLVKRFIEQGSRPLEPGELLHFWKVCTPEEKRSFAEGAAAALGTELVFEPGVVSA